MNISFDNTEKISGVLTIVIEEADYQADVKKQLNDYRKRANIPGFRPGMAPMGLIKKQVEPSVKVDVINKLVGNKIYEYVREQKINMLGEPMPHEGEAPVDLDQPAPYTLKFDIAVAPEMDVKLSKRNKIAYYDIQVDEKMVNDQIDAYASRGGKYEKVDDYKEGDMLKGDLRELNADGSTKEGGIEVADAVMLPGYMKNDDEKKKFGKCKAGDIISFNPKKAFESEIEISSLLKITKEEAQNIEADFSYQITEITRYVKHAIDQELFDQVYGKDAVKTEEAFRKRVTDDLKKQMEPNSDFRLLTDLREYCEKKVGELKFPEEILKRVMLNNNKDKGADYVEKNFEGSIKELGWHLMKEKLVEQFSIKLEDNDLLDAAKEAIKMQFAQYGMTNVPDEDLAQYAQNMLKERDNVQQYADRAIDKKLIEKVKETVKLTKKKVTLDEFNKLYEK